MQYSILIYGADGIFEHLSEEEQAKLMQGHKDLQQALKEKGPFGTARLMPTSNAVTIKPRTDNTQKPLIVDGPFAETKERFLGFYVADFENLDEAIEFAEKISSPYITLEIRPVTWAGGTLSVDA